MTSVSRRLLAAYAACSLLHLVLLATGPGWAVTATKGLLIPLLAAAVIASVRPRHDLPVVLLVAALAGSWLGDVLLTVDGWFVGGLLAFLAAHLCYVALFARMLPWSPTVGRRALIAGLVTATWYAVFLALLGPHLGALLVPVAVYGLVLGAMAALAVGRGAWIGAGGALFVVSDSVLALGRFLPGYDLAVHDVMVMTTYLAAQALIATGVVRALAVAAPPRPAPGRRVRATAR